MANVTVTGTFKTAEGDPEQGTVEFQLTGFSYDDELDAVFTKSPVVADLDNDGKISIDLAPTHGGDFIVAGLTYKVTETFTRGQTRASQRRYYIDLAADVTPVDIGVLATYAAAPDVLASRVPNGTTAQRTDPDVGAVYFDTDLGIPLWGNGLAWVDATGDEA